MDAFRTARDDPLRQQLIAAVSGSYEVGDLVGSGAMGAVYKARDRRHDRNVAIKIIRPELSSSMVAARFLREIRIVAGLQHPHILPLFDSGDADGLLFYVSPLVVGESLRQRLQRERQLPLLEVCHIVEQVAEALTYAHRAGIVHRDIKPDNILLTEGNAFVTDFGIAKATISSGESNATSSGMAVGTPLYMSPEQAAGESDVDSRTDQYALACMAFEMIAGEPPFTGTNPRMIIARHLSQAPPAIRALRSVVSEEAERVLNRALAKAPVDRFPSAMEFARALEDALAGSRSGAVQTPTRPLAAAPAGFAHAGRLVSKTCNRWVQVNAFDSFLRTSRRASPGRPQLYLMHGEEGDAHDSLLERLIHTTLSRFAEEIGGIERGSVARLRTPWPDADDLESAKRDLAIALLRESDPSYLGDDLSSQALCASLDRRPQRVVVVHHDIRVLHWRRFTPDLAEWYANEFWGAVPSPRLGQQFIVFLKLIYPAQRPSRIATFLGLTRDGRRLQRELQERLTAPGSPCACMVFKELQPLTVDDVKEWFSSNSIYDSEQRRLELAHSVFGNRAQRRMAEIESALEEIHRTFLSEQQLELGSIA
jgi:serine/threonine protein kinase